MTEPLTAPGAAPLSAPASASASAKTIRACRSCGAGESALLSVVDLGEQYLSDFRDDRHRPARMPLELVWCAECTLAQLRHTAPPALLYHGNYSFKSGVSGGIRADLADVVAYALARHHEPKRWLDIASNDGTLLGFVPPEIHRTGIDPLGQFAAEARGRAEEIIVDFFDPAYFYGGPLFDVVTSISMFYDLDQPDRFVGDVASILAPDGVWIVQQNYALDMLRNNSLDNLSHEHLAYYSVRSLRALVERHGLEIVEVQANPINGGCIRTLIAHRGARDVLPSVADFELAEYNAGLHSADAYEAFADRTASLVYRLGEFVGAINDRGGRVYVLGASTRGAVLWQAAGLDVAALPAVIDVNPAKVGRYMSAIGAPIISEAQAAEDPPTHKLLGPWWFAETIVEREQVFLDQGGTIIVPVPQVKLIGGGR